MEFLPLFLLSVLSAPPWPERERGVVYIIVRRQYAYLEEVLRQAFAGREDVKVIVDRRFGRRRDTLRPVSIERRRAERRRPAEEVFQVVIGELTGI